MEQNLNDQFCKEVGIKRVVCYIFNTDTNEVRFYSNLSGLYKKPKGWKNIEAYKLEKPLYPNLMDSKNFSKLINIQWKMFGEIGDVYKKSGNESFEYCYVKTRLMAMKMAKSFGGGDMLEEYKKAVRDCEFSYTED